MGTPQAIYVVLIIIGLIHLSRNVSLPKYNFFESLVTTILMTGLFYWGGLFDTIGIPEYIIYGYYMLLVIMNIFLHGKERNTGFKYLIGSVIAEGFMVYLLYLGEFFKF